jgi:hypothetical protein
MLVMLELTTDPQVPDNSPVAGKAKAKFEVYAVGIIFTL